MFSTVRNNLEKIVVWIGLITAVGGGFTVYGTMNEKIAQLEAAVEKSQPFNPDGLIAEIAKNRKFFSDNATQIAVNEKSIQVLELEIKELKANSKNPLAN